MTEFTHKYVNGRRVALTLDEIAEFMARDNVQPQSRMQTLMPEQKLARLGLTVAELKELLI